MQFLESRVFLRSEMAEAAQQLKRTSKELERALCTKNFENMFIDVSNLFHS